MGEEASERRLEELRQGAPLTEGEYRAYELDYFEQDMPGDWPFYYVYRLTATESDFPADAPNYGPIYFVCAHMGGGQGSELLEALGPIRSLDEVAEALTRQGNSKPFDLASVERIGFADMWDESETAVLKERITAARQKTEQTEKAEKAETVVEP